MRASSRRTPYCTALNHLPERLGGAPWVRWPPWASDIPRKLSDRKSTRLNSSHTVIYTLSLHDALPISAHAVLHRLEPFAGEARRRAVGEVAAMGQRHPEEAVRSEEHTSELQSHSDLHSFPTRRSSDLGARRTAPP